MVRYLKVLNVTDLMEGSHLIGYIQVGKGVDLSSVGAVRRRGKSVCGEAGFRVVSEHHYKFSKPDGITFCFILAESHMVVHTWPEERKLFFDVFSCHRRINPKKMLLILSSNFGGSVKKAAGMRY